VHYLAIVVVIAFLFVYHGGWNGILALAVPRSPFARPVPR
jgi:hypothetical protein